MEPTMHDIDVKPEVSHVEDAKPQEILETRFVSEIRLKTMRKFWKPLLFCMMVNWAALNDGFQNQLPGNIIANSGFIHTMANTVVDGSPAISSNVISLWGGIGAVAQTIGQAVGATSSDYIGRKGAMWMFAILFLASSGVSIGASNWKVWLGAKVLNQLALGIAISTIVTYLSEVAPFQLRGMMMGSYQLMFGIGQFIGSIATQVLQDTNPEKWRPTIASEFVITGIFVIFLIFVPESHYYYARKGQDEKAKKVMRRVYGNIEDYDVDYEYLVIEQSLQHEKSLHHLQHQAD
ncbi:hypothetical protein M231_04616 [Tremella mesenterica]|uniref:Major facilitator superfamily (MFS) profile domain-containing protein n=1 Tax=Tremella mesenterica TaxID=5217 RepID=A0A4V1M3U2_TREME|nr:hypothetical protein M231_04616 [Tremella mesenterica]